jgi:hypothetical protein
MMRSVTITGYRGFKHFEMHGLGRVNLLVGKNNSGKSSVLEAIGLLASRGDPTTLWSICEIRGERVDLSERPGSRGHIDVAHLFLGHEPQIGSHISISGERSGTSQFVTVRLIEMDENQPTLFPRDRFGISAEADEGLAILIEAQPGERVMAFPTSSRTAVSDAILRRSTRTENEIAVVRFISTGLVSSGELAGKWADISLTDAEERVVSALRSLDSRIEKIALNAAPGYGYRDRARSGFKVKLRGISSPIPIGSLGDGAWRMLALSVSLAHPSTKFLLVDEIDTGLHHSAMVDMWRMVTETAKTLDVQVFATTHSRDCVDALAAVCTDNGTDISLQRIEAGKDRSISYSEGEIIAAAKYGIETR